VHTGVDTLDPDTRSPATRSLVTPGLVTPGLDPLGTVRRDVRVAVLRDRGYPRRRTR
jgi:hypothetical protein